jgi:probable phosphoglycerate mutase
VGERIGLQPREDPRLAETDAGDWTDRLFVDVQAEDPKGFADFIGGDPSFGFPGGESFAQQGVRVAAALADIERDSELPALVVCHGVVIRIALYQRAGHMVALAERVPNAALVPLDPDEAEHAELGGGEALPPS